MTIDSDLDDGADEDEEIDVLEPYSVDTSSLRHHMAPAATPTVTDPGASYRQRSGHIASDEEEDDDDDSDLVAATTPFMGTGVDSSRGAGLTPMATPSIGFYTPGNTPAATKRRPEDGNGGVTPVKRTNYQLRTLNSDEEEGGDFDEFGVLTPAGQR